MYELINGECLEEMEKIKDKSIDLILCDLPYEITDCEWDKKIDIEKLWKQYKRIIKPNGIIILFGVEPFSSELRMSNKKWYKYDIIWNKIQCGNPLLSTVQPIRIHENISIFYNTSTNYLDYNREDNECYKYLKSEFDKINITIDQFNKKFKTTMGRHYFSLNQFCFPVEKMYKKMQKETGYFQKDYDELKKMFEEFKEKYKTKRAYNMQGLVPFNKKITIHRNEIVANKEKDIGKTYIRKYTNYPKSIITFEKDYNNFHPTQKPIKLLEYLIKTYSNENDLVLDNTMGSGSTGVACMNTNRNFIGIELNKGYFEIAKKLIEQASDKKIS